VVIIFTLLSVLAADLRGRGSPQIDLLREFRPIGGSGNNRESPDLDLEETPLTSAAINILVPTGDPVFTQGTSIATTRDTRSPDTNTIINTVAGYLRSFPTLWLPTHVKPNLTPPAVIDTHGRQVPPLHQ
jgi:hypothetical protein